MTNLARLLHAYFRYYCDENQADVAAQIGISETTLCRIKKPGKYPDATTFVKIAAWLLLPALPLKSPPEPSTKGD